MEIIGIANSSYTNYLFREVSSYHSTTIFLATIPYKDIVERIQPISLEI